jgi:hypothetical protein
MVLGNTVKFAHMALGLVPEILDPIDVIMGLCKPLRMVDPIVFECADIQRIVPPSTVRIDNAVRLYLARNDGH